MILGVLKESAPEKRVMLMPEGIKTLKALNVETLVEHGAGQGAFVKDGEFAKAGAQLATRKEILEQSEVVTSLNPPSKEDLAHIRKGQSWISLMHFQTDPEYMMTLAKTGLTGYALEAIPRISRAQSMDVLSSQSAISGYKAVLLAANHLPHFFPMLTTAAGSIPPSKVLVLGAGVAGLQAIATARRLGAVINAFDTRPEVKEEVQSLGAKFVEVEGAADASKAGGYAVEQTEDYKRRQQEKIREEIVKADVVITTALIPGRPAPKLVTKEMLVEMKKGSVVVDLAAITGGNCELSEADEIVVREEVTIIGYTNLPAMMAADASKMLTRNFISFFKPMVKEGLFLPDFGDEVIGTSCIFSEGEIRHPLLEKLLNVQTGK